MIKYMRNLIILLLALYTNSLLASDLHTHTKGIWSIADSDTMQRWIIIHNLTEAQEKGVYHIELIGHNKNDPTWKIKRLVPHMAITKEALTASIKKPLNKGDVYPESYFNAYQRWLQENNGQGGAVCNTTLEECIK